MKGLFDHLRFLFVVLSFLTKSGNQEVLHANSERSVKPELGGIFQANESVVRIQTKVSRLPKKEINATSSESDKKIDLVTSFADHLNAWSLSIENNVDTFEVEKTLCFNPRASTSEEEILSNISINVYNHKNEDIELDVTANWIASFYLEEEETILANISDGTSEVFQFSPKQQQMENKGNYLISVKTLVNENKCIYFAVNKPRCPWKDQLDLIENSELWARMLKTGFFPVQSSNFPNDFVITLVPMKNSSVCYSKQMPEDADKGDKIVEITIIKTKDGYMWPVFAAIVSTLGFSIFFFSMWGTLWYLRLQRCEPIAESDRTNPETSNSYRLALIKEVETGLDSEKDKKCLEVTSVLKKKRPKVDELSKLTESNLNFRNFLCAIPLLSIFYMVPSAQMVFADLQRYKTTGNMDHCYLNYGCSRPWKRLADFNHIVSNAGYFINGTLFIILVFIKSRTLKGCCKFHPENGIPRNYSYFYSMGICMVLQSIFSSIFHICPSNISLQFDTTIMYIMMLLVFIQTYSFRHSDISSNAYFTLYLFAAALIMEALSLYVTSYTPKILLFSIFCFFYTILLFKTVIDIYYYGAIKAFFPQKTVIFMKHSYSSWKCLYPRKFCLGLGFLLINFILMIGTISRSLEDHGRSFSTPFLVIGAVNISLYLIFYLVLKVHEMKKSSSGTFNKFRLVSPIFCCIVLGAAIALAGLAGWFYLGKHQSRNHTPEESRDKNELCTYMDFFDNHDMWHFLSASSLFLAFIFLLSIDDDLLCTPRSKIDIF